MSGEGLYRTALRLTRAQLNLTVIEPQSRPRRQTLKEVGYHEADIKQDTVRDGTHCPFRNHNPFDRTSGVCSSRLMSGNQTARCGRQQLRKRPQAPTTLAW